LANIKVGLWEGIGHREQTKSIKKQIPLLFSISILSIYRVSNGF
jgi:hypothetical protein